MVATVVKKQSASVFNFDLSLTRSIGSVIGRNQSGTGIYFRIESSMISSCVLLQVYYVTGENNWNV